MPALDTRELPRESATTEAITKSSDLDYEGISSRNAALLSKVVGSELMELVKDAPLKESVAGLKAFIGQALDAIQKIEERNVNGVSLLPASPSTSISELGAAIMKDGPDVWLRKGNHPEIENIIETRQALAHEIRDVRLMLHDELRAIEQQAFPVWKETASFEGPELLEREKRRESMLSDLRQGVREEWEASGAMGPLRDKIRKDVEYSLSKGYIVPMSEEGVAREVLKTFNANRDERVELISQAIERARGGTDGTPADILKAAGYGDLADEYSRRADRVRLNYVNAEVDKRVEAKIDLELENRKDPVFEAVMREQKEDAARVRLATDQNAPRGFGEGRAYEVLTRAGQTELAEKYLALLNQFEQVNQMYTENLTSLKELRFYHFHATNINNGAEVVEVLTEQDMNKLYSQGKDWINPHEGNWPVVHYAVDYEKTLAMGKQPSAFDTARGFDTLQAPDVSPGMMESRRDGRWSFPGNTAALLNPYSSHTSTFAETAATPLTAGQAAEKGEHGIANNTARYYEKKAMVTPDFPRREFYLSMIGGLEANTLDGAVSTDRGTMIYMKPPITPTDRSTLVPSSRAQIYDPPEVVMPKRDPSGEIMYNTDGSIVTGKGPSQGMRLDNHRVRAVEATQALDIPGYENAVLTLQRRIAREVFVPQREQWDTAQFDQGAYAKAWQGLREAVNQSRDEALTKLAEGVPLPHGREEIEALRTGADQAAYKQAIRENYEALGKAGKLEAYKHAIVQYKILDTELSRLDPKVIAPNFDEGGKWQGRYPTTKPPDKSGERKQVFGADI